MNKVFLYLFILLAISSQSLIAAPTFHVTADADFIEVKIQHTELPQPLFSREIINGLPNVLDMSIMLKQHDVVIAKTTRGFIITYDLWDEHFLVSQIAPLKVTQIIIENERELIKLVSDTHIKKIIQENPVTIGQPVSLSFRLVFNPVNSERIDKIKQWISSSNGFETEDEVEPMIASNVTIAPIVLKSNNNQSNGSTISKPFQTSSGPRFQKLFDRILEENMSEDSLAAQWKSEIIEQSVNVGNTRDE